MNNLLLKIIGGIFIFFIVFPFIQIIPSKSYNQPYALLMGGLILPHLSTVFIKKLPGWDALNLCWFFLVGSVFFILCFYQQGVNYQEYKYLYTYIAFPVICFSSLFVIYKDKQLVLLVLTASVYIWLSVALVQKFYWPGFLVNLIGIPESTAYDIVNSGRGVLSLAPEPTHYGLHMLMLGAALVLLDGRQSVVLLCLFQATFLAGSASALMSLGLGILFLLARIRDIKAIMLLSAIAICMLMILDNLAPTSRILTLIKSAAVNPLAAILGDHSSNIRLGGMWASLGYIFENNLIPHGLSNSEWLVSAEEIKNTNLWLKDLSHTGVPSGLGVILFQSGFLLLPSLAWVVISILRSTVTSYKFGVVFSVPFIILGQYYLSSALFSMIYAAVIFNKQKINTAMIMYNNTFLRR